MTLFLRPLPLALSCLLATTPSHAIEQATVASTAADLASLSFEQLGELQITSVSRRPEALSSAAGAVYVITGDEIRRSGATTLPEALRLAPNLHVAQASASGYAISARGLNGSNTSVPNKLLVMIDGRSVYTPLFSGVFWDVQDVVLEDVERIEVVSGPGGTLWGVNAVNGVINVVTRRSHDTLGTVASGAVGTHESTGLLRHGRAIGDGGALRLWANSRTHEHTRTATGQPIDDAGWRTGVGLRADVPVWGGWASIEAAGYDLQEGQPEPGAVAISGVDLPLGDIDASGGHLMARWQRLDAEGGGLTVQAYLDHTRRRVPPTFSQQLDILDVQLQHGLAPLGGHSLTWGANLRTSRDRVQNSPWFAFLPGNVNQRWYSLFAQDDIQLSHATKLTLGARAEHNDYTGTELLPNARLAWQVDPVHLVWGAWSRAVRAPSRLDVDAHIPGPPPYLLDGGHPVRSEVATVTELGYRGTWGKAGLSATVFHADYDHLRTVEIAPSRTYLVFDSQMRGRVQGLELWAHVQPSASWRLSGGLTVQDTHLELKPGSEDAGAPLAAGNDPDYYWQVRSAWNIGVNTELDIGVRHVEALPRYALRAYTVADVRLAWHLNPDTELALIARNLGADHGEYREAVYRSHLEPSGLVKATWRF